jgi:uncharacterized membrane protein
MGAFHVYAGADRAFAPAEVRQIGVADLFDALRLGFEDFRAKPSHVIFLCLMYPLAGVFLVAWSSGANLLPLAFPLMSGFAILGPLAAIGLYEISRRREMGQAPSWRQALEVRHSPALGSIVAAGLALFAVFIAWLVSASQIYAYFLGTEAPSGIATLLQSVMTTPEGWWMMVTGDVVGFLFAALALAMTVVTFPLLLDRDIGALAAIATSIRATVVNPVPVAVWGLIVAALLIVGTIPVFAGLAIVMPILGHATWHLYRKLVIREDR